MTACCRCRRDATQILLAEALGEAEGLLYALVCCRHQREVAHLLLAHHHPLLLLPSSALSDLRSLTGTHLWQVQPLSS
jgi:hypothetical protein